MGLETTQTISGLISDWPEVIDPTSQGDDHIKLLKSMLKAQFPGQANQGFAQPIDATEVELNYLSGTSSNVQTQFNTINTTLASLQTQIDDLTARITVLENA